MKRTLLLLRFLLIATGFIISCQQRDQLYDLVIVGALIIDGTGSTPYRGHVVVQGDSIILIDKDTTARYAGKRTIQAKGLYLTPGFIDTHAHGDPLETPAFRNFLAMGVTTICLGQDGFSPDYRDLGKWMNAVDSVNPAVNIALFAGHNTLRMLSGVAYDSMPDKKDLIAMEKLLGEAMDAGCFGMTTGLEYTPGYYAGSNELVRLAKIVGQRNGLVMSHMRNEDDRYVESSVKELLLQGQYCPVHISHIKVVYGKGEPRAREILDILDSARSAGIKVTADIYPDTASYTGIGILFPDWAKKPYNFEEVLGSRRAELGEYLRNKIVQRNGPGATLLGSGPYKGKTLADVAAMLNKPAEVVLMDEIGPYGASGAYFIMDEALQETFVVAPYINICTDGSPGIRHPRGYGSFARVIEKFVMKDKSLTLREAVHKMSGLPAQTMGLESRGIIKPGKKADMLLFNPSSVQENASYEAPHQLASGFEYVIVNGEIIKEGEKFSNKRKGLVLRKNKVL